MGSHEWLISSNPLPSACFYNSLPVDPVLNHKNIVHTKLPYLFKICFNVNVTSHLCLDPLQVVSSFLVFQVKFCISLMHVTGLTQYITLKICEIHVMGLTAVYL